MAIVGYSYFSAPSSPPKMSALPGPTRPLSKPLPKDLLTRPGINLTPAQRDKITAINSTWERKKSALESAMSGFRPRQGRLDQVQGQLASYSDLSRQFETERIAAWSAALNVLDSEQARKVSP